MLLTSRLTRGMPIVRVDVSGIHTSLGIMRVIRASITSSQLAGILYGRENAFREAISCYNRALEITQNSSSRHITLANRAAAYIKIKKFAEALDDSREAAKLRPDYAM